MHARRIFSWRLGLLAAVVVFAAWIATMATVRGPSRTKITISKETTFITGPLDAEGYVDYFAALNAVASKGVTPENNAAVLLYQAFGPGAIPEATRAELAKLLGIEPLPDRGHYFEEWGLFIRRNPPKVTTGLPTKGQHDPIQLSDAQLQKAESRPWSKSEFPLVAAWLEENEKPMELAVAATKRPQFYFPVFKSNPSDTLIDASGYCIQQAREISRALDARAMLRLNEGRIEEAWQGILACHRLARLIGQGPTLIHGLLGYAVDGRACSCDAALAQHGRLTAAMAKCFAEDLRKLPPLQKVVDKMTINMRYECLDGLSHIARFEGPKGARFGETSEESDGWVAKMANRASDTLTNWDDAMRIINVWLDRLIAACAKPNRVERASAVANIVQDLDDLAKSPKGFYSTWIGRVFGLGDGQAIGLVLVALVSPAVSAAIQAEDRAVATSSMSQIVFALAGYRADHGEYPAELAQLCPKYLAAIPEDPFSKSNGPLRYKRSATGYVLYSVGFNGKDDGGRNRADGGDASVPNDADDIAVRMPPVQPQNGSTSQPGASR